MAERRGSVLAPQPSAARPSSGANAWLVIGLGVVAAVVGGVLAAGVHPLAGFGAIAAVGLAVAVLTSAEVGLLVAVAIIYLLPFAVFPLPLGGVKLTFLDITITVVLVIWLLRQVARRDEGLVVTPLGGLVLVFVGLAITSFVIGINSVTSEAARFFLKTVNSILFFFSVVNVVRTPPALRRLCRAILLAAGGAAVLGIAFYVMPNELAIQWLSSLRALGYPSGPDVLRYIAGTTTLRATGTAIDPNVFGGMLVLALPLAVSQLFAERASGAVLPRRLLWALVPAMVIALGLTLSRGAWVGGLAGVLFLASAAGGRYRRAWLLVALVIAIVILIPQGDIIVGRVEVALTAEDRATQMRLGEYGDSLRLISLYPWFGVGFGAAPSVDLYVATASIYLLMAEQMGLIGLSCFLLIVAVLLVWAFRAYRALPERAAHQGESSTEPKGLLLGALSGLIGALSAGLFDHYFFNMHFPHTIALFWLFVGVTAVAARLGREWA